jgi:CelD/BcsL family acetyltransferase involved in cellulose biosynthesis
VPDRPIEVSLLASGERDDVGALWRELERAGSGGITVSWAWTETWLRHYGEFVPHRFAVCRSGAEPCALALITSSRHRRPGIPAIRVLHLGTAGAAAGDVYVEWNRLLALPRMRAQAAQALRRRLAQERGWDELRLDGFDPAHAEALLAGASRAIVRRARAPVSDLAAIRAQGVDILDALSSGVRRRLRQSLTAFGELEAEWAADVGHAHEILEELARLHGESWRRRGEPGAFADPTFSAFHHELVERLVPAREAILFRVTGARGTVGCLYCLSDGPRVLFYQSGLAQFGDNRLRAGLVTHLHCMRACLERGFDEYDFLVGEARYKEELATGSRELVWASLRRPRLRLALLDAARAAGRLRR